LSNDADDLSVDKKSDSANVKRNSSSIMPTTETEV